jgi:3-isopropylmalate dehydrogenase
MTSIRVAVLPGDGIGPEVIDAAWRVFEAVAKRFDHQLVREDRLMGGCAIDATGDPLPPETLEACRAADAVLLGAVGGPKWDGGKRRPEEGLLGLRKGLGLFANLRPVGVTEATLAASPLKPEIARGVDLLIVRELTGGLYFGDQRRDANNASDQCIYTVAEIERIARLAFDAARKRRGKVTSVDKANVLETSRLWRETVSRVAAEYPDVTLDHMLVDNAAMQLIRNPRHFDVLLTENMFGDILSDEASVLAGSIGLLGSASLGKGKPGLFEPIHGSAPDIAGTGKANPIGTIMSVAMLLRHGLGLVAEADVVESAVAEVLASGVRTPDLGGADTCVQVTNAIVQAVMQWRAR